MRSLVLAALTVSILGCSGWLPPVHRRAPDGSFEVAAPVDMEPLSVEPPKVLHLGSQREERSFVVAALPRADWVGSPEEFSATIAPRYRDIFDDRDERPPRTRTVGGLPAFERELVGTAGGVRMHAISAVVAGETSWFSIQATSSEERWPENEAVLRAAIDSFVEKRAPARAIAVAPPAVVAAHDGSVSLELPADWRARDLSEHAVLQLGDPDQTAWFLLVVTPRGGDARDLAVYAAQARDGLLASLPNATAGDFRPASAPLGDALLVDLQWRDEHLPRVGVHATVRGPEAWYELIGWTIPSLWDTHRATFDRALQTLRAPSADAPASQGASPEGGATG